MFGNVPLKRQMITYNDLQTSGGLLCVSVTEECHVTEKVTLSHRQWCVFE